VPAAEAGTEHGSKGEAEHEHKTTEGTAKADHVYPIPV